MGIDLVHVGRIAASIATFGDRFLHRVFTEHELASATGDEAVRAERLAARFAAKEATVKVLQPATRWTDWRSIEVVRSESGQCQIALHGFAHELAERAGIRALSVSMSHEEDLATAVVIGEQRGKDISRLRTRRTARSRSGAPRSPGPSKAQDGASRYRT